MHFLIQICIDLLSHIKHLKDFKKHSNMFRSSMRKEINKKLPEDDLIEDRNMLECFLKCFKCF